MCRPASTPTSPADRLFMQNKYSAAYKAYQDAQRQANLAQEAFRALMQKQEWEADRFRTAQLGERDKVRCAGYCMHGLSVYAICRKLMTIAVAQSPSCALVDALDFGTNAGLPDQEGTAAGARIPAEQRLFRGRGRTAACRCRQH